MLHSFGKNVLVFIPEYALKEVHNSQMIGISQINASTAINKLCNTIEEVILSVPCCQHEVNKQIKNEMLEPVLRYGILKERMSALITDAVRADLLESKGYDTQILEFIDMEHTPKNLLIRAVRTGKRSDQGKVEKMLAALNIHPTLDRLLNEKEQEGSVR